MAKIAGPYTPFVPAGGFIFLSGQVGLGDDAKLVSDDVLEQFDQAFVNMSELIEESGAKLTDVVKVTLFLTDSSDFPAINERYLAAFGGHKPARSAIVAAALPLGAKVEIEALLHP